MITHLEGNRYEVTIGMGGTYLVDLDEFGYGQCGCRDFECRHLPKLQKLRELGMTDFPKEECKHIIYLKHILDSKSKDGIKDNRKEADNTVKSEATNEETHSCILHNPDHYPASSMYWFVPPEDRKTAICEGCQVKNTCENPARILYQRRIHS